MSTTDEPKPRRYQFSLRALLLVCVPVALAAMPLGYYLRRPRPPVLVPVTGTVTYKGQSIGRALITFHPRDLDLLSAFGFTDTAGAFTLQESKYYNALPGAAPGSYTVTVHELSIETSCPERYASPDSSPLRAEVTKEGANHFAFQLTTP
jgi:hypothetical protein